MERSNFLIVDNVEGKLWQLQVYLPSFKTINGLQ